MPNDRQLNTAYINIAVTPAMKDTLEQIADEEHLRLSDIGRRAFRAEIDRYHAKYGCTRQEWADHVKGVADREQA